MFRLMLVTDRRDTAQRDLVHVVRDAVEGGVDCVQVREKDLDDDALSRLVSRVIEAVRGRAAIVVNGRPAVSKALGVGVHLPEGDAMPDFLERATLRLQGSRLRGDVGAEALRVYTMGRTVWGRSVHSVVGAAFTAADGPDYLLLGTLYETASKPGLEGSGPALLREVVETVGTTPVLGIGGIDVSNAADVVRAGACGVAVRSALLRARDPARAAEALLEAMAAGDP